jgi:hypothetical protein
MLGRLACELNVMFDDEIGSELTDECLLLMLKKKERRNGAV